MNYTVRTCCVCGLRAPQPEMTQRKRSIDVGKSRDSFSTSTVVGSLLGDKASTRKIGRSILNSGQRTYSRKITSWYCKSCAGKAGNAENGEVVGMTLLVLLAVIFGAFFMFTNREGGTSSTDTKTVSSEPASTKFFVENSEGDFAAPQSEPLAQSSTSPSFDCDLATKPAEFSICASLELANADRRLNEVYDQTRAVVPEALARKLARDLHAETMACGADNSCLSRQLQQSIEAIENLGEIGEVRLRVAFESLPIEQRKYAQQVLKQAGFYRSNIDGAWGPGTRSAIYEFVLQSFTRYPLVPNITPEDLVFDLMTIDIEDVELGQDPLTD